MKITYLCATSRDGFIATTDGDVSWLEQIEVSPEETGLADFMEQVDGLIFGRKTYDFVFEYGTWPYGDKPSWVCTNQPIEKLTGADLKVMDSIERVVEDATAMGLKHLWLVGGGQLASSMLDRELITNISITEFPVTLGQGIPLFATHQLNELNIAAKTIQDHEKFRQIEISLERE